jgi:hypothetical protein
MFESAGNLNACLFVCKICNTNHVALDTDKHGVHIIPSTITTSRDRKNEYFFHCVVCPRDIK